MTIDDPAAFAPPPAFGPFRVLHQIGIGALGPVFRTYEPTRDRLVAVKVFRLDITPEQAQTLADELARASDAGLFHPSVVEPIAAGVEGTVAYRAEEYVAAESLDAAIRHYAPAALDQALPFLTQLAGAIDFARVAGVGHGALHLRDVFVTPEEARASGFGVVEALERVGLRAPVRRPYTAPERIAGAPWSTPADVFSLAAITYELLTGRRPSGTGEQIGPLTGDHLLEFGAGMRKVLARAMSEEPGARYPTALAFASALEAAAHGGRVTDAVVAVRAIAGDPPAAPSLPDAARPEPARPDPAREFAAPATIRDAGEPVTHPAGNFAADDMLVAAAGHADHAGPLSYDDAAHVDDHIDQYDAEGHIEPSEPTLFDEEAAADRGPETHDRVAPASAPSRLWDDAEPAYGSAGAGPVRAAATGASAASHATDQRSYAMNDGDAEDDQEALREHDVTYHERSRPAVLPIAVTLVLGLLVGFAAGYWAGGRESGVRTQAGTAASPAVTAPDPGAKTATAAGTTPGETPKAASEQATARPPAVAPSIPGDGPASAADRPRPSTSASRPAPTPAVPASTTGKIAITSTPAKASVMVNGKWRGRTPLRLDAMKFGSYNVRVVLPGFATAREDVALSAAEPSRTIAVRLQKNTPPPPAPATSRGAAARPADTAAARSASFAGSVYVDSRPRGARILIDGQMMGTTPARVPGVSIGSHVVRLELTDHRPWTVSTRVAAGEETRVTGSLERLP